MSEIRIQSLRLDTDATPAIGLRVHRAWLDTAAAPGIQVRVHRVWLDTEASPADNTPSFGGSYQRRKRKRTSQDIHALLMAGAL